MLGLGLVLAATPALPLGEGGKYVAGAYIVFVLLLLIYVGIMASKLQRIERELREVAGIAEERKAEVGGAAGGPAAKRAVDQSTAVDPEVRAR
jgi:hypothetical protein